MIVIGRHLLLIATLSGVTLSVDDRFSEEDIKSFLDYILILHNVVRFKHKAKPLIRTDEMDNIAHNKMYYWCYDLYDYNESYEINYNSVNYDRNTQLDVAEAKKFFSLWYEQGNFYNYTIAPDMDAGGFTKIVWKDTKYIGLAFKCKENEYKVLVVYDPPGNRIIGNKSNINRPKSDRRVMDPVNNKLFYQTETEWFLDYILELHNEARKNHGVSILKRDVRLDKFASIALENMSHDERFKRYKHSGFNYHQRRYDINTKLNDAEAVALFSHWYNSGNYYNYNEEPKHNYADEFTQIVWKGTERFGIAIGRDLDIYRVLVFYDPPGNIPGQFRSNVFMSRNMDQGGTSENN